MLTRMGIEEPKRLIWTERTDMSVQRKAYFLVLLMLMLSFSAGLGEMVPPLEDNREQFVLTPPASVNAGGYQEGSIFTQATIAIGAEHMCMILDNASVAC